MWNRSWKYKENNTTLSVLYSDSQADSASSQSDVAGQTPMQVNTGSTVDIEDILTSDEEEVCESLQFGLSDSTAL